MWVLLIVLAAAGQSGDSSMAMHDFSSQAACEKARDFAIGSERGFVKISALCTPK